MDSQSDFEHKLRLDYLQEAKELLADAEACFLKLEHDNKNSELIDRIFRMIHTVKGSGSIVGFNNFTRFAHQFENLLALIRTGKLTIDAAIMDLMLEANDRLKDWLGELEKDHSFELDAADTIAKLAAYTANGEPQAKTPVHNVPAFGFFDELPEASAHAGQPMILLVDDEPDILDLYEGFLEGMPVQTVKALEGAEALAIINSQLPAIIVLDLKMPKMNGMEFFVQARKKLADVPVIFVSGYSDRADIINMLNQGAFAFLNKPVNREVFLAEVRHALRERAMRLQLLKLTQLNFMAFLTLAKISHSRVADERQRAEIKMKQILDELVDLQNSILEAKYPQLLD